jgi:predicted nucleic-acid-binding Zn-ribbon protein
MSLKGELLCPHCEGRDVWHVETIRERGEAGAFEKPIQPLNIVLQEKFFKLYNGTGHFETYICKACGFTEWYAVGLEGLEPDPANGIHLLKGTPEEDGPYR